MSPMLVSDRTARTIPSVSITPDDNGDVWAQFSEAVKYGAETLGFKQPNTEVGERQPVIQAISGVVVAPGIMVSAAEYQERYGGIDLEALRKRMKPAVYRAFVRYIGSVRGGEDLDVTTISDIPDD